MKKQRSSNGNERTKVTKYHVVLFQTEPGDELSRSTFRTIRQRLDRVVKTAPEETEIDIWLECPGGDAHAAYKLNLDLRSRCSHIRAIVPDFAKSAATLLAMGADEIYMAPAAELGPLDAQIQHPSREEMVVSALDVAGSFEFVGQTAVRLILGGGGNVINATGLARAEVLKIMADFAATFLSPVVAKLDPHLVHRSATQLIVAEKYAHAMLKTRTGCDEPSDDEIRRIIRRLVTEYPTHGFVINRDEVAALGLPVRDAIEHPRWPMIKQLHEKAEEAASIITVIADSDLDAKTEDDKIHGEKRHEEQDNQDASDERPAEASNGN